MAKARRFLFGVILVGLGLVAAHLHSPPRWLPWKPLDLADPPGFWTNWKLLVLADAPQTCRRVLREAGVNFTPVPDQVTGEACGFDNAGQLGPQLIRLAPADAKLSCPMTAALHLWMRDVVQPAAERRYGSVVTSIHHFGTYSCRNVAGTSHRSQHATANAIDIAGFTLANGQSVSVLKDWNGKPEAQDFLREVRDDGCRIFSANLNPDYNAAHRDHFHLDLGLFQTCP
jgi:hypothetical protein